MAPTAGALNLAPELLGWGAVNAIPGMPVVGLLLDGAAIFYGTPTLFGTSKVGPYVAFTTNVLALTAQVAGVVLLVSTCSAFDGDGPKVTGLSFTGTSAGLSGVF